PMHVAGLDAALRDLAVLVRHLSSECGKEDVEMRGMIVAAYTARPESGTVAVFEHAHLVVLEDDAVILRCDGGGILSESDRGYPEGREQREHVAPRDAAVAGV